MQEAPRDSGSILGSGWSPGGGNWQPTPVFLPEESHGQRSLAGYSPWGHKESDKPERLNNSVSTWVVRVVNTRVSLFSIAAGMKTKPLPRAEGLVRLLVIGPPPLLPSSSPIVMHPGLRAAPMIWWSTPSLPLADAVTASVSASCPPPPQPAPSSHLSELSSSISFSGTAESAPGFPGWDCFLYARSGGTRFPLFRNVHVSL